MTNYYYCSECDNTVAFNHDCPAFITPTNMNESKPYMSPQGYVDPTSKYYIDRMWEEYHKMKEELADTKSKLGQSENYISETLKPQLADAKIKLKMAHSAWDELDKSHASRAKLHDELIIAEGQRDQWKMRAEAGQAALVSAQMEAEAEHRACERVIAERDALLKVYEAAKVWAEVTDPPRTDNYREFREATINLLDVVALVSTQRVWMVW